jgi:hypothetical protein
MEPGNGARIVASFSFFFGQPLACFAGHQQGFQPVYILQCDRVPRLGALKTAGSLIQLLLGNQFILEHLLRSAVLALRIIQVGCRALHRSKFLWIGWGRLVGTDAELRAHLSHQSALAVDFQLQFLRIDEDQGLAFPHRVSDVGKHLGNAAFDLRAQDAFFQSVE